MKVRVVSDLESARGIIPAGTVISVTPALLARLVGKVELVPLPVKDQQSCNGELAPPVGETPEADPFGPQDDSGTAPGLEGICRAGIVYANPPRCYACRSTDLWLSRHGATFCRICHAPAPGAEAVTGAAVRRSGPTKRGSPQAWQWTC
jgi:hypothetical protein